MNPADVRGAAVLVLHEEQHAAFASDALERLRGAGFVAAAHVLSSAARDSDRRAMAELDRALGSLAREPGVERERVCVLGFARGGTLAFLLGCTRRVAVVVDVDGPVLHPALTAERPTQPLELALNLEGAFLGLFARRGAVGDEERELLRARLASAARPCELLLFEGTLETVFDPRGRGYDGARAAATWRSLLEFLHRSLTTDER